MRQRSFGLGNDSLCGLLLAAGMLAAGPLSSAAHAQLGQLRSVSDVRPRIPDELDRPYVRETQSHRGWEVREPQFTVFASTTQEDARLAARHVQAAWDAAAKLASRWTATHRQADFGLNSLQVAIVDEPRFEHDRSALALTVAGLQTQATIHIEPGKPWCEAHLVALREGAAYAMFHAAELDGAVPPWLVLGLSSFAAREGWDQPASIDLRSDAVRTWGGAASRPTEEEVPSVARRDISEAEAANRVRFLLTGDDAQHAPALFALIRDATQFATANAVSGRSDRGRRNREREASDPFAELIARYQPQYEAWLHDPLAGQPIFEPHRDADPEVVDAEREMLIILKLARRYANASSPGPRTKVADFTSDKGQSFERSSRGAAFTTMEEFAALLTNSSQATWATIDVDGSLLLSTDRQRVTELLAMSEQRYRLEQGAAGVTVVRRWTDGRLLRGWLEEPPKNTGRPLAKFEIVAPR